MSIEDGEVTLKKIDGRKCEIRETKRGEIFDGGAYGGINESEIEISRNGDKRNHLLAVKNFKYAG